MIDFFAAAVVICQLRGDGEERETPAVHLIGITFFVFAAYLAAEMLVGIGDGAERSPTDRRGATLAGFPARRHSASR